jgi:two-component system, NtrC family, sensor kinase
VIDADVQAISDVRKAAPEPSALERRLEDALRESEAFYQSLVESLPQNIIRKDRQGRFTYVNQRLCATLKLPREQIIGKTDFDLFPKHLAEKYRQDDAQVLETGTALEAVETHQTPDGRTLYVQIVKTPITDARGQLIGTQVMFWDVTERKQWEEALSDSERRYRQLTEASQDGIVVTDASGRITLFNPAAERMFACPAAEALGAPIQQFIPDRQPNDPTTRGVALNGRRRDADTFPLELCVSRIESAGEPSFLHTIRDLTERNRMRDILVQSEKLASIGLLSAGVAHEINNPLSYVSNNLAVLERDVKGLMNLVDLYEAGQAHLAAADPDMAERVRTATEELDLAYIRENFGRLLGRTREGVQRVTGIVRSLRGLARTAPPKMVEASLPELVDMSVEMIRGRMQRQGVTLETDYGPIEVHCVESQISQVLLNLLVNALHAIEAAGRTSDGLIRISSRDEGSDVLIEITDNGCGIDAETLPKLFDPFFTTKPVGEGTGLGLSITHGIITGHGGRIEVESEVGVGSRFRLFLPRQRGGSTE